MYNSKLWQFDPNAAAVAIDTAGDGSAVVKGTPVSRGVYKGSARVVTRLADAESIQKVPKLLLKADMSFHPVRHMIRDHEADE